MKIILFGYGYYVIGNEFANGGTILRSIFSWLDDRQNETIEINIATRSEESMIKANERLNLFKLNHDISKYEKRVKMKCIIDSNISDEYDACIIATPEMSHLEIVSKICQHTKNIICVKPFCNSPQEYDESIKIANKNATNIIIDFHKRFDESNISFISDVKKHLSEYNIFKFSYAQKSIMPLKYFSKWSHLSNPFQYLAPHYLDIIRECIGESSTKSINKTSIQSNAITTKFKDTDVYSSVNVIIKFEYSAKQYIINADCNWMEPNNLPYASRQRIEFINEKCHYISEQDNRGQSKAFGDNFNINNPHYMTSSNDLIIDGYGKRMYSNFLDWVIGIYPKNKLPSATDYSFIAKIISSVNSNLK